MEDEKNIRQDIRNIVTCVNMYHGITLISVSQLPNQIGAVCELLERFSDHEVNIDMISLTPSSSPLITLAFTAESENLGNIFKAIGDCKKGNPNLRTEVAPERCKVIFSGKEIATRAGTAAYILKAFEKRKIAIDIITTSHKEISCLISDDRTPAAKAMIEEDFGM